MSGSKTLVRISEYTTPIKADIKEIPKPIFIASDKERNPSFIFLNCINANSNKPVIIRRDTIPTAGGCW